MFKFNIFYNKKVKFIGVDYYKYNYFCDMFLLVCL